MVADQVKLDNDYEVSELSRPVGRIVEALEIAYSEFPEGIESVYSEENPDSGSDAVDVWATLEQEVDEETLTDVLLGEGSWEETTRGEMATKMYGKLGFEEKTDWNGEVLGLAVTYIGDLDEAEGNFVPGKFNFLVRVDDGINFVSYSGDNRNLDINRNFGELKFEGNEFWLGEQQPYRWGEGSDNRIGALVGYLEKSQE